MKVHINREGSETFDHQDIMGEIPFDVGPFIDKGEKDTLYIPVDDVGTGPFWLQISGSIWQAYCTENLPVCGPLVNVDPTIEITF